MAASNEDDGEIVARVALFLFVVFVKFDVVESDLDGRTLIGQVIEVHAHFVERLAEILVAAHRPAHLQNMALGIKLNAGLFLIGAGCAIGQGTRARILPERLERFLQLLIGDFRSQRDIAVQMDFEGSVEI